MYLLASHGTDRGSPFTWVPFCNGRKGVKEFFLRVECSEPRTSMEEQDLCADGLGLQIIPPGSGEI